MEHTKHRKRTENTLTWWQLALLGVASTIGTGYFLGSSLGIRLGGPAVLISFVLAAIATFIVFDVLARMTAEDPREGSFRSYAKKAYGRWAGFSSGWMYWCSEVLIMGSQMTALAIFSRFWFPAVPMWIFAAGYAVLGLLVIWIGNKGFDRLENVLAVIKVAAIVMFLVIAAAALMGWLSGGTQPKVPATAGEWFPTGALGLWSSLIFAFYAFGGIEVMGVMAIRLKDPKEAPKSGRVMILLLSIVYVISLGLSLMMVSWRQFSPEKSPFVVALSSYDLPFIPHIFNAVLIVAGFSTMVASLYAVTTMLVTLSEDKDAPKLFAKKKFKRKTPVFALGLTAGGLIVSIVLSLIMPGKIYEFLTTGAGLMLLYNWLFILISAGRILKLSVWGQIKRYTGMLLIVLAVAGTAFHHTSRPGLWISLAFAAVILIVVLIMQYIWRKAEKRQKEHGNDSRLRPKPVR
ncbi:MULTISPECIES: amino acid permease [Paenibacillus]|uniref:Amino acid permease n=1 Tax=Paenibacillus campinasensis TaxID=66347 RepID=A0A268EPS5_9BACL|nr:MULTISPECIES: amino acid permease [Paenibacillus]MUG66626.1 amino acid permease [Paenibacillus campinasensis]PAD75130.1 amino acid permease [Paenibacillus campinasensis]PAK50477.1 amino acid permease [Paenibacillus sp. 7541]